MSYEKTKAHRAAYHAAWKETDPTLAAFVSDTITSLGKDRANAVRLIDFARWCKQDAVGNSTEASCFSGYAAENAFEAARRYASFEAPTSCIVDSILDVARFHADSRLRGAATARERQIAKLRELFPEIQ